MKISALLLLIPCLAVSQALALAPAHPGKHPSKSIPFDPRIAPVTGSDNRHWPPDRLFDYQHLRLEIDIPDMARAAFHAKATWTLAPIAQPQSSITLDAGPNLFVKAVQVDHRPASFTADQAHQHLTITFAHPVPPHQTTTIEIAYDAIHPFNQREGLVFSSDDPTTPAFDPQCHSQGESEHNHLWFPCHDFPDERFSSEIIATVPAPFEVVSNGKLIEITRHHLAHAPDHVPVPPGLRDQPHADDLDLVPVPTASDHPDPHNRITYHWSQRGSHPAYLVAMIVGRFDVVAVGGPSSTRPGLAMPVYGPLGSADRLHTVFARTPDMISFFENRFGVPYPWEKFAQVACRDFENGGMENTSCVTLPAHSILFAADLEDPDARFSHFDETIAHELAHQWFGDLVNCRSWAHVWLNEGFATFAEALWAEHATGRRGYNRIMLRQLAQEEILTKNRSAPADPAMVSNLYTTADHKFMMPDNVYSKGALVLNMLRNRLGDKAFFEGIHNYLADNAYRDGGVETDDLRFALEEASGQSLERFFDQWVNRPGHPVVTVTHTWTSTSADPKGAGTLTLTVRQTQLINADNPAYAFELPVVLVLPGGTQYVSIPIDTRQTTQTLHLNAEPTDIQVNPDASVLCEQALP